MPDQPILDLATADHWLGFRPGMSRTQVREQLQQTGSAETRHSDDNFSAKINGDLVDFWFASDGSERLRQISLEQEVCWNGKPLADLALDDLLKALEPLSQAPMWEANDATDEPFPDATAGPAGPVSDQELLEDGTVWLPDRQLGFVIWHSDVMDVVWRTPQDMPARFAGPVTAAQRQLSLQADPPPPPDLSGKPGVSGRPSGPKKKSDPLQTVLIVVCLGWLALIGRAAFQETQRWAQATTLPAKFVSMEQVPRKKFFDLGPERVRRLMPDDPARTRDLYHLAYLDPSGHPQSVTLEGADFYVPPREPGEEASVAYLAGDPPRVKGVARVRDVAFLEYLPWAMVVGVFYILGLGAIACLPRGLRMITKLTAPKGGGPDRDHPELR